MIDSIFSAALTFCLLSAGTLAIGSAMFEAGPRGAAPHVKVVQLERVEIVGKRLAPAAVVADSDPMPTTRHIR